ncbi:MAG: hypothetical protein V1794_17290, partial [Candidatus Glassbacteria bacterium]
HGLNGILLSAGMDQLDIQPQDYIRRLFQVRQIGRDTKVEIIPAVFSIGYGGAFLAHDRNLAAGQPVVDALFVVKGGKAQLAADPPVEILNGGFEKTENGRVAGFTSPPQFGQVISQDTQVAKEGKASLRFENFGSYEAGAGKLAVEISVHPQRLYRMSCWIRSEGLDESRPFGSGNIRLQATAPDGRPLEWININMPASGDWQQAVEAFNSLGYDRVVISVEAGRRQNGKFWVDGLKVEEAGLVNLLRRPGTPVTVKSEKTGTIYEEGKDYARLEDKELNFRFDHDGPAIELSPGSRIKNGERLRVSFYHGTHVYDGQVTACMSEPAVYDIMRTNVRMIQDIMHPTKYFLPLDEIRNGGACQACVSRKLSMGQMLGDFITQTVNIIHEVNPDAEVFIWSDMLDPNHNARADRAYYYLVPGNFSGSWNYIPKDLVIACWYFEKRRESLDHFSGLGYRTLGAAYYDADDLENPTGWLAALDATPNAVGIMYTTWLDKYDLLDDFGDLVSKRTDR